MSFISNIFGGGGGAQPSTPASQTSFVREAPGIEERKIELMDIARQVAQQPVSVPAVQVAPTSALEQQGITAAGQTGVGAPTLGAGIGQVLGAAAGPNISQFYNPYQSYVIDEINRQAQMGQNRLAAQAIGQGAFGGGREGVQRAELQRGILSQIGQAQAAGFGTALQRAYEPYQRIEFLKGIMTNLPTTQSTLTATTAPGSNPLAQAAGTALGGYAAYNMMQPR